MIANSSKVMFFITAPVQRNTLVQEVYFYNICIVYNANLLANKLIGYALMVIVLSKCDMIVFLHLGNYLVLYYKQIRNRREIPFSNSEWIGKQVHELVSELKITVRWEGNPTDSFLSYN